MCFQRLWDLPPAIGVGCPNDTPTLKDPSPLPNECLGTPYYIEDLYNTIDDDVREKLKQEVMIDANIELACVGCGITTELYKQFAAMIIADWKFQDLDDKEWTKKHFMSVLRHKVADLKQKENGFQITKNTDRTSDPLTRAAIHTANIG